MTGTIPNAYEYACGAIRRERSGDLRISCYREHNVYQVRACSVAQGEDDKGVKHESHNALVFISCPGMTGREIVERDRSIMGSGLKVADRDADDCYALVPVNTEDGTPDEAWIHALAEELGIPVENVREGA